VVAFSRPNEIDEMLKKVEPLFEEKDYLGAEKGYEQILEKFPADYSVQLDWGDAALFSGRPAVALTRYEKATRLNPADHRSWYYRGNALAALGKKKEAIDAWVRAIAMRPDNTMMLTGLEAKAAALGYAVRSRALLPSARVEPVKDGFRISVAIKEPHWLAWGVCKAMWRGEPDHRKAMTGREKDTFSIIEEKECLVNTMAMYENRKKDDAADPMVERMIAAMKAKLFAGYLVYEIASRVEPHVFLQQPPETQRVVEEYVRRFILVPKARPSPAGP
jgi:tetratricopeptide (TPR) repeat protein